MRVLLAGESWQSLTFEIKARNVLIDGSYEEGAEHLVAALESNGTTVDFLPCHEVTDAFPRTAAELSAYDAIILSDIGADSLQITPRVAAGETDVDRCRLLADYVRDGGALGMVGGYMSFAGVGGRARYARTALAEVLPVEISHHDDRVETPQGVEPRTVNVPNETVPEVWPAVLGYNRLTASPDAEVWATVGDDPLLVVGDAGTGSTFAFATDCAPHWAPRSFLEWEHLPAVWEAILDRVVDRSPVGGSVRPAGSGNGDR